MATRPAAGALAEIGMTGLRRSGGYVQEEWLRDLQRQPWKKYREMAENDAVVGSTLYATTMLMRRTSRRVEPADKHQRADLEAAEFIESCLDGLLHPWSWSSTLEEILSFLTYGWGWHEEVLRQREDGKIVWAKLPIRSQDTLTRWEFSPEGADVIGMWQSAAPTYREVMIPAAKSLHFVTGAYKGNPEGRSLLRRAYRSYYFASRIEEKEAIGIERELCGLPVVTVPWDWLTGGANADQKAAVEGFKKLATDIRLNEQGGALIPAFYDKDGHKLVDIQLLSTQGRRAIDTDKVIGRYDQRKAMTVLADFILLGHEKVGSFSLGVSKAELFATAIESHLGDVAAVFNYGAIPRLLALNGMKGSCKLAFGQADRVNLAELGAFISDVGGIDILLDDNEISRELRAAANLPDEVTPREPPPPQPGAEGEKPPVSGEAKKRSFPAAARNGTRERVAKDDDDFKGDAGAQDPAIRIADRLAPRIRADFLAAVERVRGVVDLVALEAAIIVGDVEGALAAAGVELLAAELAPVLEGLSAVVLEVGPAVSAALGAELKVAIGFDVANVRVVNWLAQHGAELVTGITDGQRAAIRARLVEMAENGQPAASAAKDIVLHIGQTERDSRLIAELRAGLTAEGAADADNQVAQLAREKLQNRAALIAEHESLEAAGGRAARKLAAGAGGRALGRRRAPEADRGRGREGLRDLQRTAGRDARPGRGLDPRRAAEPAAREVQVPGAAGVRGNRNH